MDVNALVHGAPWAYGSSFVFVCRFVSSLVCQMQCWHWYGATLCDNVQVLAQN